MNIIFAKHDALNKEYLFEVPEGMHPVKGDVLWVDTSKGETVATATSDMISGHGVEQIAEKFGAYFPLKKVLAYANKGIETYINNRAYEKVVRYCCGEQKNVHAIDGLPF